jgi:hypothetical protein
LDLQNWRKRCILEKQENKNQYRCQRQKQSIWLRSDAAKEAIWLQDLLQELKLTDTAHSLIHQDNQGAIFIEKNASNKQRIKHIDIRHHFIREQVERGRIIIQYCPTEMMLADILTKPLGEHTGRPL